MQLHGNGLKSDLNQITHFYAKYAQTHAHTHTSTQTNTFREYARWINAVCLYDEKWSFGFVCDQFAIKKMCIIQYKFTFPWWYSLMLTNSTFKNSNYLNSNSNESFTCKSLVVNVHFTLLNNTVKLHPRWSGAQLLC